MSNATIQRFKEFDWSDQRWQRYLAQDLYPLPPASKIIKFKKRWYKKEIDSNFDVDALIVEEESAEPTGPTSAARREAEGKTNAAYHPTGQSSTVTPIRSFQLVADILLSLALLLTVATVLPTAKSPAFHLGASVAYALGFIAALIGSRGTPKLNAEWWTSASYSDTFQAIMMAAVGLPVNVFMVLISPAISALIEVSGHSSMITKTMPALEKVRSKTGNLLQYKANLEVMVGTLLLFRLFFAGGGVSFIKVLIYWNIMRMKFGINGFTQSTFRRADGVIRSYLSHSKVPAILLKVYDNIAKVLGNFASRGAA